MTGTGTELDPFIIGDVNDLQAMENDLDAFYELANDIDASITATWNAGAGFEPIGIFTGSLDGKGFTITDLYINRADTVGLFGLVDGATLENLTLANVDITNTGAHPHGAAGVVCSADLGSGVILRNVHVSGQVTSARSAGGLVESIENGQIIGCSSDVHVTAAMSAGGMFYYAQHTTVEDSVATGDAECADGGGFARWIGNGVNVTNCYATGDVTTEAGGGFANEILAGASVTDSYATGNVIGGATGYVAGFAAYLVGRVERCYATGDVTGDYAAGFIADVSATGVIEDCYTRGDVEGVDTAAGFTCWVNTDGVVRRSYSTGAVTGGASEIGGFIAYEWGGTPTIEHCFWDTETSGQATSDGGTGKPTEEMKQILTFSGWDIATSPVSRNAGYPFLSWEIGSSPVWLLSGGSPRDDHPLEYSSVKEEVPDKVTLECIRNVEMEAMGRAFIDKNGNFHYDSRFGRNPL